MFIITVIMIVCAMWFGVVSSNLPAGRHEH